MLNEFYKQLIDFSIFSSNSIHLMSAHFVWRFSWSDFRQITCFGGSARSFIMSSFFCLGFTSCVLGSVLCFVLFPLLGVVLSGVVLGWVGWACASLGVAWAEWSVMVEVSHFFIFRYLCLFVSQVTIYELLGWFGLVQAHASCKGDDHAEHCASRHAIKYATSLRLPSLHSCNYCVQPNRFKSIDVRLNQPKSKCSIKHLSRFQFCAMVRFLEHDFSSTYDLAVSELKI